MSRAKLSLLAATALVSGAAASSFKCDLPDALDPAGDGLPSAHELFSSQDALLRQVERHRAIVRVPTICYDDMGPVDQDERWEPFYELQDTLEELYPVVHERAKPEKINTLGLLYTFQGTDKELRPILLTAHQDVVPVAEPESWTYPPFSGHFNGTWLWGRGAVDDKGSLSAIMAVMETLLSSDPDWLPKRTILVAFGFDEECSGLRGAAHIAPVLERRYGKDGLELIFDEGGLGLLQLEGDSGGDDDDDDDEKKSKVLYALPSVYEKGYLDVWFDLNVVGGHSSVPFPHTAIGVMAQIVNDLEANPFKPRIVDDSPVHRHLQCQARYSPRAIPQLTKVIEEGDLEAAARIIAAASCETQYIIQTSQAVDVIVGGFKINAMPESVSLGVNYRIAVHDSLHDVQRHIVELAAGIASSYGIRVRAFEDDAGYRDYVAGLGSGSGTSSGSGSDSGSLEPRYDVDYNGTLAITKGKSSEPSPVTRAEGPVWDAFAGTIRHTYAFADGIVVPAAEGMTANTDTRHYLNLSRNIYRWTPVRLGEFNGIHTIDEGVMMTTQMEMVMFYYNLVRVFNGNRFGVTLETPSEL
ncbi:peptidase [Hirsutella rhossiliensis]|uniref:Peptidase family m20/M25/M40 domain-containing protein n=1 Tax=Hirsutella rhossiliensis TaxID=111463 RepID=A0A9P8SHE8_9HYPO|nr:peptidase family m20/M25/M40 domain-containing protein [Hirsutella rhossiliensis]KAH0962761.1 peptidase family m20/M25/M40 domain-containing protein [Hirsutella rhossiliensis]